MAVYYEDWGATYGTYGEYLGFVKGTLGFFGSGAATTLIWSASPKYIGESITTYTKLAYNCASTPITCGSQSHQFNLDRTALFFNFSRSGTKELWACVGAYASGVIMKCFLTYDNNTTLVELWGTTFNAGTSFEDAKATISIASNGTWTISTNGCPNGGNRIIHSRNYALAGYTSATMINPSVAVQCLYGPAALYSSWYNDSSTPDTMRLTWATGSVGFKSTNGPDSLTVTGKPSSLIRNRKLFGSMGVGGWGVSDTYFKRIWTLNWSYCSAETFARVGSINALYNTKITFATPNGTYSAKTVPGSFVYKYIYSDLYQCSVALEETT